MWGKGHGWGYREGAEGGGKAMVGDIVRELRVGEKPMVGDILSELRVGERPWGIH